MGQGKVRTEDGAKLYQTRRYEEKKITLSYVCICLTYIMYYQLSLLLLNNEL